MVDSENHPVADFPEREKRFVILCSSGFDNVARARSALMYATLAAFAQFHSTLYCVQDAVDIMVKGSIERYEDPTPGNPTLAQRLREALDEGVEILCCSQTLANKRLEEKDLVEGVKVAGAMTLISLTTTAQGTLSF